MLKPIIDGVLVGLLLAVMIGPIFLALMSITISEGKRKAYWFMAGNALCDWVIAFLAYKGVTIWAGGAHGKRGLVVGILGAVAFITYGVHLIFKKEKAKDIEIKVDKKMWNLGNFRVLIKGFIMNGLNPSIGIFWVTVLGRFIHKGVYIDNPHTVHILIISTLITFLITDIIKINSADFFIKKLTLKTLDTINTFAGIALLLAGFFILGEVLL